MIQYLKIVTILFLIVGCNSIDKDENYSFLIEGRTNEIDDGTVIQLLDVLSNKIIDSIEVKNNKFSFNGIQIIRSILEFRGYIKSEDYFYIYNDKFYKTKNLQEAEELISKIPHQFEHYGSNEKTLHKRKI